MSDYIEVRTKKDLELAVKNKAKKIIVKGELAEKIHNAEKITKLSKPALGVLAAAIAATPFTGGISGVMAVGAITATTGMAVATILAIMFLGIALIISITDGYDRRMTAKVGGVGEASMELTKKQTIE
ncbi:hypothetical protein [Formivibrio citricus]|uniref:hypothetical protein n=1 Tax=Formivibrio citricus TaxID=83765 RepID=UPI000B87DA6D|nr:hypothetical protein [Formivibrio citricus]